MGQNEDYFSNDTIVAIATSPVGDGGVGVIRISGPMAVDVGARFLPGLSVSRPRYLNRTDFISGSGEILDDGLVVYFPEGASFTGESVVEFQGHGGRFLLQRLLQELREVGGCRQALPGEFSFRAVRNGRISLDQAEAIQQLVAATSQYELNAARRILSEGRRKEFDALLFEIRNLLSKVELSIDFVDQDVEVISKRELQESIDALHRSAEDLLLRLRLARTVANGIQLVLVGEPNSGKSTLFNALLSEDRALVSDQAGTTRDVVSEAILIGPYKIRLLDTAGLRETANPIERQGIDKSKEWIQRADLVIGVVDGAAIQDNSAALSAFESYFLERKPDLIVVNKADLLSAFQVESLVRNSELFSFETQNIPGNSIPRISVSAKTQKGVAPLIETIQSILDSKVGLGKDVSVLTESQLEAVSALLEQLSELKCTVQRTGIENPEILSAQLMRAANSLRVLAGETTPDDVLMNIFSEFCIGK